MMSSSKHGQLIVHHYRANKGVRSEALLLSSFYQKKKGTSSHLGGRVGLHCKDCAPLFLATFQTR